MTITPKETKAEATVREQARKTAASLSYATGFGNEHSSEALAGALPVGRNTPQHPAYGLYTELLTGTAFTETRENTRRTWLYRIRPSVASPTFEISDHPTMLAPPFSTPVEPNLLYWDARPAPAAGTDFLAGLWTLGGNGDPAQRAGMALHIYTADTSMTDRVFRNADGELLIVPELGGLLIHTELGVLSVEPGEIAMVPRSIAFRVEILGADQDQVESAFVRGYVIENFGAPFSLPELGYIGQSGMANARDFRIPTAAYDDSEQPVEVTHKIAGSFWTAMYDHSPLDVVAWHGNSVPFVYDLHQFQIVGAVNFDHADPSRLTTLSSKTAIPGLNNIDFLGVTPEWAATEDTFRPQYFHRNISTEFAGVIEEPRHAGGFRRGIAALTNTLTPHGVSAAVWEAASNEDLSAPSLRDGTVMLLETQWPIVLTPQAAQSVGSTDDETLSGKNTLKSNFRH